MADDSDEDDYVFYGTSLQDEGDNTLGAAGRVKDPALARSLPVHQQEVTDEQGRKRFHGAFTGGYSAGYYNTVGSKVRAKHDDHLSAVAHARCLAVPCVCNMAIICNVL